MYIITGPFTYIIPASKEFPKLILDNEFHTRRWKRKVFIYDLICIYTLIYVYMLGYMYLYICIYACLYMHMKMEMKGIYLCFDMHMYV
jgi:biotin transporter BioY